MADPDFHELSDHELQLLTDDQLIAYVRAARDAGAPASARRALAILVFGYMDLVRARVALKVPTREVEDVADIALVSAITSAFDGQSIGEFRSWLNTIVARRIADYHRRPQPETVPLVTEGEEGYSGAEPAIGPEGDTVDIDRAIDQVYEELSHAHRQVVDLYVFGDRSAADTAAALGEMSEANVHQIGSRFRRRLRELLEARP